MIEKKGARFIKGDYYSHNEGCVTEMLCDLDLPTLQQCRKENRLCYLYKIAKGLVPAIPRDSYLTRQKVKRQIRAKTFSGCDTKNFVTKYQNLNSNCFVIPDATESAYANSFFPKTICDWNQLSDNIVSAPTVSAFRSRLREQSQK